ncbi:hypothetical protein D3C76_983670 [compost metagenome]
MLRLAAAVADGRAELLAMAWVQPLIGFVDGGVGKVGEVAAGFTQFGLAGDVAPDDAHLLTVALAPQVARQFVLALRGLGYGADVRAQLAGGIAAIELAAGHEREQHARFALGLAEHEIAGRGHLIELLPVHRAPSLQVEIGVGGHGVAEELLVADDQRLQGGGQIERQRQAHGLSLIGVKERGKGGQMEGGPRLDCHTKVGNS